MIFFRVMMWKVLLTVFLHHSPSIQSFHLTHLPSSTYRLTHPPSELSTPNCLHQLHPNAPTHHDNPRSPPSSTFSAPPVTPPCSRYHAQLYPPCEPGPSYQEYCQHPSRPASSLLSPERVMFAVLGRDTRSLRVISVRQAREWRHSYGQCIP